jgi:hypothetical protein
MKRTLLLLAVLGSLVVFEASTLEKNPDWQLVYSAESLQVQRRDYAGSNLDEIRGTVRLKASLNSIMALLKDAEFNIQWVYRSGGARVLEERGYAQAYVYGVVDAPFPISDRDTVVRFDYQQDPQTKVITVAITNVPDFLPAKDQLVRVPEIGGFWRLKPEGNGWVEVTYQVYGDPGGWLPDWLANRAALMSVQNTLRNMRSAVKHYRNARSEFVSEYAGSTVTSGD